MKIEKNYLTANEIRYISNMLLELETEDYMLRQIVKYLTIADFCTDFKLEHGKNDKGEDTTTWNEMKYDELWSNGDIETLDKEIKNIYLIDEIIEDKHSTYNMFNEITEKLGESIKNFDINETKEIMSQIGSLINKEEK